LVKKIRLVTLEVLDDFRGPDCSPPDKRQEMGICAFIA